MKSCMIQFWSCLVYLLLMGVQTQNFVDQNVPAIGITSVMISISWIIMVAGTAGGGWKEKVSLTAGGAIGAMLSVPLHNLIK